MEICSSVPKWCQPSQYVTCEHFICTWMEFLEQTEASQCWIVNVTQSLLTPTRHTVKIKAFCSGMKSSPGPILSFACGGSSHLLILLWLTSIEWMHQSVRAIMGNTSAVHYERVCMYKVVMRLVDINNPWEHLSRSLTISQHGEGSQPLLWHLPVVLTWRGNFFLFCLSPPPLASPPRLFGRRALLC